MIDVIADRIVRKNPFLRDWSNYGIIDIFNPVATAQYQHSVTIASKSGMMHDFRDLRFFQADGTEIPFWNESKTDGSTSFSWFKPYSPSLKNVYVFYGNREAVSQSNGDKVFELFDDFLGSALDTSKWTAVGSGYSISTSIITMQTTGASDKIYSNSSFGQNYSITAKAQFSADATHFHGTAPFGLWTSNVFGSPHVTFQDNYPSDGVLYARCNNGTDDTANLGTSYTGYRVWQIRRTSAQSELLINGSSVKTSSAQNPSGNLLIILAGTSSYPTLFDYIYVRKYTATEPVCQLNQSGLRNPEYR